MLLRTVVVVEQRKVGSGVGGASFPAAAVGMAGPVIFPGEHLPPRGHPRRATHCSPSLIYLDPSMQDCHYAATLTSSFCLSIYLSVFLPSFYLSFYLCLYIFLSLTFHYSVFVFVFLSFHLSFRLSIFPSFLRSVFVFLSFYLSIFRSF